MSSVLQTARRALAKTKPASIAEATAAMPAVDREPGSATHPPASPRPGAALEPSPFAPCVGWEARKVPGDRNAESLTTAGPPTRRITPAVCGGCDGALAPYLLPLAGRGLVLLCTGCHRWTVIGGTA